MINPTEAPDRVRDRSEGAFRGHRLQLREARRPDDRDGRSQRMTEDAQAPRLLRLLFLEKLQSPCQVPQLERAQRGQRPFAVAVPSKRVVKQVPPPLPVQTDRV